MGISTGVDRWLDGLQGINTCRVINAGFINDEGPIGYQSFRSPMKFYGVYGYPGGEVVTEGEC